MPLRSRRRKKLTSKARKMREEDYDYFRGLILVTVIPPAKSRRFIRPPSVLQV